MPPLEFNFPQAMSENVKQAVKDLTSGKPDQTPKVLERLSSSEAISAVKFLVDQYHKAKKDLREADRDARRHFVGLIEQVVAGILGPDDAKFVGESLRARTHDQPMPMHRYALAESLSALVQGDPRWSDTQMEAPRRAKKRKRTERRSR